MLDSPLYFFLGSHSILRTHRVHGASIEWCYGSVLQWYYGSGVPVPSPRPLQLIHQRCYLCIRRVTHLTTSCYWCDMLHDLGYTRSWTCFLFFRLSLRARNNLPSFPFSGTHHVLRHNVFRGRNFTGQLHLVCKLCWLHVRHISTICEPCGAVNFWTI